MEEEIQEEVLNPEEEKEEIQEDEEAVDDEPTEEEKDSPVEKEEKKPKQDSAKNEAYAKMRREKEAKEKAYRDGAVEALGGINPYTNEKIEDEVDFQLYKEMKEAEKAGFDPSDFKDFNKYRKEKLREEMKSLKETEASQEKIKTDIENFVNKYPDVDVKKLFEDKGFNELANNLIGKVDLDTVYQIYQKTNEKAIEEAKIIAQKSMAREISSTIPKSDSDSLDTSVYSKEELSKLTRDEIEANWEKVERSMDKNYFLPRKK